MIKKNKRKLTVLIAFFLILVPFAAKTFAEDNGRDDQTVVGKENVNVLDRDLSNEAMYYGIIINDKSIALTENEFKLVEPVLTEFTSVLEIQDYLIEKDGVEDIQSPAIFSSRAATNSSNLFPWNNWQNNSIVRVVPDYSTGSVERIGLVGNRFKNTFASTIYVDQVRATVPVIIGKKYSTHVVNASGISRPQWDVRYKRGINKSYYDINRTRLGPSGTFQGQADYVVGSYQNVTRKFIDMYAPNKQWVYFHPTVISEIGISSMVTYNTPALNGHNNNLNRPLAYVIGTVKHPQLVKAVHVDKNTGKVLKGIQNFGQKGFYNDEVRVTSGNFTGYTYDSYEVYSNRTHQKTSTAKAWSGRLNENKRGIVFYYTPIPKKYNVRFVTNGGSSVATQIVEHGNRSRKPSNPTYTGKNFEGWYADNYLTIPFNFNQGITQNTTVYAKWSPKKYNVKFETNGGTNVGSQTVEHGKTSRKPSNPTYTGKNFEGWYADSGLKTPFNFNQGITKDTTVYAKWSDKKYTVRFETNGGDKIESQTVQHGKTSTEPVPPTYGDKGFEGWYADSKFETVFDFTKPITKDTVVYAKWRIQKYKVQFETNGGSKVDSQSVEEGKKSTKPTDPTYPAKEFKGWYKTNEFIEEFNFDQPITEDITLYAKWRSKILDPKDGKTPVTPVEGDKEKPQNNTSKELRIQYVSDFDFGKVKNSSLASQELSDGDSVLTDQNEKKEVPSFISIIDDRPKNKGSWSLYSKATSFVSQTGHEMMGAELILKDLNYAKEMSKTPSIEGNSINLSTSDPQLITKSSNETSNGSWSLAFGSLNSRNKSTGAVLSIPRNTIKANTDYHSVIEWTLVPEI